MNKLLITGDLHIRGNNPRNRKDDYLSACFKKITEICELAKLHNAVIINTGDVFDSPSVSYGIVSSFIDLLNKQGKVFYSIPGNHDIIAHNLQTLPRTPFNVLQAAGVIASPETIFGIKTIPFNYTVDRDYSEYQVKFDADSKTKTLVCHTMILPDVPVFDRFSLIDIVADNTEADVIISGHYHLPFEVKCKGKLFINPGAVMRMSATEEEINRIPHVVLLDQDTLEYKKIPLKSALPGNEVLDRDAILENKEREAAMQSFLESLGNNSESRFLNLQEIIERVAGGESEEVIQSAMKKLSEARERRM